MGRLRQYSLGVAALFLVVLACAAPCLAQESPIFSDSDSVLPYDGTLPVVGTTPAETASYFPVKPGLTWWFRTQDRTGGEAIDRIAKVSTDEPVTVAFETYAFAPRVFTYAEGRVYEAAYDGTGRLWYDFTAPAGSSWVIQAAPGSGGTDLMDGTTVTVRATDETITVPYGTFRGVYHLAFAPDSRIADAGLVEEWFAPGVGCVKRVMQSIAGPVSYELADLGYGGEPLPPPLQITVDTDKETYESGEPISIRVNATNTGREDITLQFKSSFQADYYIDWNYQWSRDKFFTEALTSVTIPAGQTHTWPFNHTSDMGLLLPGVHLIAAEIPGYGGGEPRKIIVRADGGTAVVSGTVIAPDGTPLSEAYVSLGLLSDGRMDDNSTPGGVMMPDGSVGMGSGGGTVSGPVILPSYSEMSASTDDAGHFEIGNVPVGVSYGLSIYRDSFLPAFRKIEALSSAGADVRVTLIPMGERYDNTVANSVDGVQYELGVDKFEYMSSDRIRILYRITNIEKDQVVLRFPTGQRCEFVLSRYDGEDLWRWSQNKRFEATPTEVILNYGESLTFNEDLDLQAAAPSASGPFHITASLVLSDGSTITQDISSLYVKFYIFGEVTGERGTLRGLVSEAMEGQDQARPLPGAQVVVRPAYYPLLLGGAVRNDGTMMGQPIGGSVSSDGSVSGGSMPMPPWPFDVLTAVTDGEGRFQMEGPPVGSVVEVSVFLEGYEAGVQTITMAPDTEVGFKLQRAAFENVNWVEKGPIRYQLSAERVFYSPGETVRVRCRATNTSRETVSMTFPTAQTFDLALTTPSGSVLWRWSDGQAFAQVVSTISLDAGQSVDYEAKFDLSTVLAADFEGTLLLTGWLALPLSDVPGSAPLQSELAVKLVIYPTRPMEVVVLSNDEAVRPSENGAPAPYMRTSDGAQTVVGNVKVVESNRNAYGDVQDYAFVKLMAEHADTPVSLALKSATVQVAYTDDQIAAAGLNENNLRLFVLDEVNGRWQPLPSTVDMSNNIVSGESSGLDGTFGIFAALFDLPTAVTDEDAGENTGRPATFVLHQNRPNPFNPSTTIEYDLAQRSMASLAVFDITGAEVRVLIDNQELPPGRWNATWDGRDGAGRSLASGVYLCRLIVAPIDGGTGAARERVVVGTRRMLLVR